MRPLPILLAAAAASALAGAAYAVSDKAFLTNVIETDNTEIQLGQYAAQHASSTQARAFGQMLQMDHSQHKTKVEPLASADGITDMNATLPAANAEMAKLAHLNGRAFDHEFGRFMTKGHEQAIAAFQHEERTAKDPAVRKMAQDTLPTLHKHLRAAEQLERD